MKSTQAQTYGWIAAGVLALGMNSVYHSDGAVWARSVVSRVADQSAAIADAASERVDRFVEKVELTAVRAEASSSRLVAAVTRTQTRMARVQTAMAHADAGLEMISARQEAQLARMEANRARIEVQLARVRFGPAVFKPVKVHVACQQVHVCVPRVSVPQVPTARFPIPVVHIERMGAGPV